MPNEIAEQLQAQSIDTAFPLSLPEIEDVVEVQEALLIHIPACFRDFLLSCSNVILGELEPVTIADPSYHTYLPEVAALAWEQGLPREFVPLCQIAAGYYVVAQDDIIYFWHSDDESVEEVCDDVWAWARDIWLTNNSNPPC